MSRHHRASIIIFCALLLSTFVASALHADIYEWEWVNPANPLLGKYETTNPCPHGAGLDPLSPPLNAEGLNLTKGYLEYDLTGSNFRYATLTNADFDSATLINADFTNAIVFDATFSGATITSADFSNTTAGGFTWDQLASTLSYANYNLTGVNFSNNFMVGWNFNGQNLTNANLASTNLCYASLRGATLGGLPGDGFTGVNFTGAAVVGADLSATTAGGFSFDQLKYTSSYATFKSLREINLGENNLSEWELGGLKMVDTVFDSSTLAGADLQNSNFRGASFRGAWLAGNDTINAAAKFSGTRTTGSILIDADFSGATLTQESHADANFGNAIIAGADFTGVTDHTEYEDAGDFYEQIESTTSHESGEMMGVVLADNTIDGWDLEGKDLRGANFDSAELVNGVNMKKADLTGASFKDATLSGADFTGADLSGAAFNNSVTPDFDNPLFAGAKFNGATIAGANFSAATNYGFSYSQFELTGSYVSGELQSIDLSNNALEHWNFSGKDMSYSSFDSSSFEEADFSGTDLTGASFHDADFDNTDFSGATIKEADLSNTTESYFPPVQLYVTKSYSLDKDLTGINLSNNTMTGWNFSGQNMTDAVLESSDLTGADFSPDGVANTNLTGASFCYSTLENADFTDANLTDGFFEYANLTGADLTNAKIVGTNFFGVTYVDPDNYTPDDFKTQFYLTDSYTTGQLTDVGLGYNNLDNWNFAGKIMTRAAFDLSTLVGANFTGADLRDTYFYYSNLTDANLSNADLSGANLKYAKLYNTDFNGAIIDNACMTAATAYGFTETQFRSTDSYANKEIQGICLSYCDLSDNGSGGAWDLSGLDFAGADFTAAMLSGVDLSGSNLSDVCFEYAMLDGTIFNGATIAGANLSGTTDFDFTPAQFYSTASYVSGQLTGVNLSNNYMLGWDFGSKEMSGSLFIDSLVEGADFTGATLVEASFHNAFLEGADFSGANLYGAIFTHSMPVEDVFVDADFTDAVITWADFSGATTYGFTDTQFYSTHSYDDPDGDLTGVNLSYNDLAGWDFAGKYMAGAWFEFSDLTGAFFNGVDTDLTGASFYGAALDGADFSDANLTGAWFEGATLWGAEFEDAVIKYADFWAATHNGFSFDQLESTQSYQDGILTGIGLGNNDLRGWDFSYQDLTGADFTWSTLGEWDKWDDPAVGADFEGAIIAGANFTATVENGFTFDQFESTQSYQDGKLAGVVLDDNDLRTWNFNATSRHINLAGASFRLATLSGVKFNSADLRKADFTDAVLVDTYLSGANLTDANFTDTLLGFAHLDGADARGAVNICYERAQCSVTNFVKPDGHVEGLHITDSFRVWDYDGLDTDDDGLPDEDLGITVYSGFSINETGKLIVSLEDDDWGSTISFDADISDIVFDGTFEVELRNDYVPIGDHEWQIFDFSGVDPLLITGGFEDEDYILPTISGLQWDYSELLTTGYLSLFSAMPGDADYDGIVDDDDLAILCKNWLQTEDEYGNPVSWDDGNFNDDDIVDDYDLIILITNYTPPTVVPEPGAIVLLICGALACLALRRFKR